MKNLSVKSIIAFGFIALLSVLPVSTAVFGQEIQNTTQLSPSTKTGATSVKIGVALPKAAFSEGVDNGQAAIALREMIGGYFKGTNIEVVEIEARLPQAITAEAKEKGCAYVLQTSVSQKKGGGGGFGMFQTIAPALGNVIPMAGRAGNVTGQVVGQVAQTAIMTAANMSATTKSKDQFTFQYSLVSIPDNTIKASESIKAKAKSDGEDVLSPLVEKMAEKIVEAVK